MFDLVEQYLPKFIKSYNGAYYDHLLLVTKLLDIQQVVTLYQKHWEVMNGFKEFNKFLRRNISRLSSTLLYNYVERGIITELPDHCV